MGLLKTNDEWFSIIQECRASGMSDKDWCREHGIPVSTFYYNIRKLRRLACAVPAANTRPSVLIRQDVVPLSIAEDVPVVSAFATNEFNRSFPDPSLTFMIESNGISITCPDGISSSTICSVIHALLAGC